MSQRAVDALEALAPRERQIGFIVTDDDASPQAIERLALSSPLGRHELAIGAAGVWTVAGTPVGPSLQRECEAAVQFVALGLVDLRALQGTDGARNAR